jgi:diguanylate cyclase (GGDEF)-like protein
MKTGSNEEVPKVAAPGKSLTQVLGHSEHVKDLVAESAEELSSVNLVLTQELAKYDPLPEVKDALAQSASVENKVHEASEELSVVNQALAGEVRERQVLEQQLAVATVQGQAALHASFHDPLTGLPNRALFNDRLEHGLAQAKRHGWTLAVMFLDLNDFKKINDSYGHDAGDGVLRAIAERLKENVRGDDTISRHGGDEFLYLLMEIRDEPAIKVIAEKIVKAIAAPCKIGAHDLTVSASIGISIYPKHGTTADALLKSADTAMYVAKRNKSGYAFAP